jgi:hypothetical protein
MSRALRSASNLAEQILIFTSPSDREAQLYVLPAPGSLFVAFYYTQGYGGGIRPRLHMEKF